MPEVEPPAPAASRIGDASVQRRVRWLLVVLAIAAGGWPLLGPYFVDLGQRPPYALYPLLIVAAALLAWTRGREAQAAAPGDGRVVALFLGAALILLATGGWMYVRWLAGPAAWLALAGLAWRLGGGRLATALLPAGILLATAIPPPNRAEVTLTVALQSLSVLVSTRLLDLVGVLHTHVGNVITIPGHKLLVEEACSGINSVVAVTAFTLLAGFWNRRPAWRIIALLPLALLFVVGLNIVRIAVGAILLDRYGLDLFNGTIHEWLGLLIFAGAIALVQSADIGLELLSRRHSAAAVPVPRGPLQPIRLAGPGRVVSLFAIAFLLVGSVLFVRLRNCWPAPRLQANAVFRVPATVGEWSLLPDEPRAATRTAATTATHARQWAYRGADGWTVEVAIAYPFTTWFHDPRVCYALGGWSTGPMHEIDPQTATQTFSMRQVGGRFAQVLYADFAEAGDVQRPFARPTDGSWLGRRLALTRRAAFHPPSCEVQVLASGDRPLDEGAQQRLRPLFEAIHATLRQQVAAQTGASR